MPNRTSTVASCGNSAVPVIKSRLLTSQPRPGRRRPGAGSLPDRGAKVILCANLWASAGLTNGTLGLFSVCSHQTQPAPTLCRPPSAWNSAATRAWLGIPSSPKWCRCRQSPPSGWKLGNTCAPKPDICCNNTYTKVRAGRDLPFRLTSARRSLRSAAPSWR